MTTSTIPQSRYDAVVIGARVAGAATAMLLARAGHRVLMVDRGRYGTDTLSTHALMRGAVVQLHRWNLLRAVIESDTTPVRQATFFYGDESLPVPIAPRDGIDALYAPRRYVLDQLLVDAADAAGADIVYGVRVKGLLRSDSGSVIGVELEDASGHVHHVTSSVVVGADGMRSAVAQMVGAETYRAGQHASGTMYGHWSGLDVEGYGWYFVPGISAAAIPTNGGQVVSRYRCPAQNSLVCLRHQPERGVPAPAVAGRARLASRSRGPDRGPGPWVRWFEPSAHGFQVTRILSTRETHGAPALGAGRRPPDTSRTR
jgi:2-polyprenyl-6-methoxyphenol hydroxylase-like FAD-dependent oxidoreductase